MRRSPTPAVTAGASGRGRFARLAPLALVAAIVPIAPLVVSPVGSPAAAVAMAARTPTPTAAPDDLRVVAVNLLHGTFCDDGAGCDAPGRVELFARQLVAAGCPAVVGVQEANRTLRPLLAGAARTICSGRYRLVFADSQGNDDELVLTTLPVRGSRLLDLPGPIRHAGRVVLDAGSRDLVVVVSHQDGDSGFPVCRDEPVRYRCPAPCPEGTDFPTCQTILVDRLTRPGPRVRPGAVRVLMGDFNVTPGSPRHAWLLARGWLDTHLAAGNAECDPASGAGCTAGRDDQSLAALRDPTARQSERIDYIFVKPPKGCTARLDGPDDADRDGLGTGTLAAEPASAGPGGLVWPSDHTAVSMDMACS